MPPGAVASSSAGLANGLSHIVEGNTPKARSQVEISSTRFMTPPLPTQEVYSPVWRCKSIWYMSDLLVLCCIGQLPPAFVRDLSFLHILRCYLHQAVTFNVGAEDKYLCNGDRAPTRLRAEVCQAYRRCQKVFAKGSALLVLASTASDNKVSIFS